MSVIEGRPLTRDLLLKYFVRAAKPRDGWLVGMEVEKMGRALRDGAPLPYSAAGPSVLGVIEFIQAQRGGAPVMEGDRLIGLDAPWGTISLEPGGQVEWSSRPAADLDELREALAGHLAVMRRAEAALAVRWLDSAVDPATPLDAMPWMPKARYHIMRPFLGARGRLAHRMMTQTASIQVAFDYADEADWKEKFRLGAMLAPVATALFANSPRIDGKDTGFRSYRTEIWRETDPARCGLPSVVFDAGFCLETWLDHLLDVPTIFRHRARGLVPAGAVPFSRLLERGGCDSPSHADWETHLSTIFTDVRAYTYIEVRSADLVPDERVFEVPTFWTGLLYDDDARGEALERAAAFAEYHRCREALYAASRDGLDAAPGGVSLRELAADLVRLAIRGLRSGARCGGDPDRAETTLAGLAGRHSLRLD